MILLQFSYRFKHFRDWLVNIRLNRNSISCCHVGSCFNNNSPSCLDVSPAVFARIWLKLKIFSPRSLVVTNILFFFFFGNEEGTRVSAFGPVAHNLKENKQSTKCLCIHTRNQLNDAVIVSKYSSREEKLETAYYISKMYVSGRHEINLPKYCNLWI